MHASIEKLFQKFIEAQKSGRHAQQANLESNVDLDGICGVPSGFSEIDLLTKGFRPGDLVILAGEPAVGKTSFALNVASNATRYSDRATLVLSLQKSKEDCFERLISSEAGLDIPKIETGPFDGRERRRLAAAADEITGRNILIENLETPTIDEIRLLVQQQLSQHDIAIILIDGLDQLRAEHWLKDRNEKIAEITRGLKTLSMRLSIPVLLTVSLGKGLNRPYYIRPTFYELPGDGSLEEDADVLMFLCGYRSLAMGANFGQIQEIHIEKNRNGPITENRHGILLAFARDYAYFEGLSST